MKCPSLHCFIALFNIILISSCTTQKRENATVNPTLFTELGYDQTNISFSNQLKETKNFNILTYEYLYNGGGVAVGDIDNDGLADLFFTATFGHNALYLNKGNFKFADISESAGITNHTGICTGTLMVDINNDGWLDIFVCQTGFVPVSDRKKLLYINNHNNTFTESAAQYGIDDASFSNQATFFDYDRDGDLDLFLANHMVDFGNANTVFIRPDTTSQYVSFRLYKNEKGHFSEHTKQAGLFNQGYALSAAVADINSDSYPDIYVCDDYLTKDHLYINNKNGTFSDQLEMYVRHTSNFCMGSVVSDFNNDGLPDIITLDMTAEDNYRKKMLLDGMSYDGYQLAVKNGYYHQYMRNMLQLNNGNNTFSEIGQLAGINSTDWSWAPLLQDFDNDGWKDLFITNGYRHDVTNLDYSKYTLDSMNKQGGVKADSVYKLISLIPSQPLLNYVFRNNRDLTFSKKSAEWGIQTPTFSNGAAYADLDNDGDLDLVVNNIDQAVIIYRNNTREQNPENHFVHIKFSGQSENINGIGASVKIETDSGVQVGYNMPFTGYLSGMENQLHFGLGSKNSVKKLTVSWPDGKVQEITNSVIDKTITLNYADAKADLLAPSKKISVPLFTDVTHASGISYRPVENEFIDFKREPLLPQKFSMSGPALAVADINGDGTEDFFIGGATGFAGCFFIQDKNGVFKKSVSVAFEKDKKFEDVAAGFFDADKDGDKDLYVVSGGNEFDENSLDYQDRLYLNDGRGNFTRDANALPEMHTSGSCVRFCDFDGDGDLDVFAGGKITPGKYPVSPRSYLLENKNGKFTDITERVCPALMFPGMINDALWSDMDGDKRPDLILAGMWTPIMIFTNDGTSFTKRSGNGLDSSNGWWNCISACDADKDGDVDFVVGNLGYNSQLKARKNEPCCVYAKDFDNNGSMDAVMCYYVMGKSYPAPGRDLLLDQVRSLRKKFLRYEPYANAQIYDIFPKADVDSSLQLLAYTFATSFVENLGHGKFNISALPLQAQFAPVQSILCDDFDKDGNTDILLAENSFATSIEFGRYDAGNGLLLKGNGHGIFKPVNVPESGFFNPKDARCMQKVKNAKSGQDWIVVANNNDSVKVFRAGDIGTVK